MRSPAGVIGAPSGTIIAGVLKGGPAEKAGIKPGDILLSVADKPVGDTISMLNLVAQFPNRPPVVIEHLGVQQPVASSKSSPRRARAAA